MRERERESELTRKLLSFTTATNTVALCCEYRWHGQRVDEAGQLRDGREIGNVDKLLGSCLLRTGSCSS